MISITTAGAASSEKAPEFNFEVQQLRPLLMSDFQRLGHFGFDAKPITTVAWDLCWIGNAQRVATSGVLHLLVESAAPNHALQRTAPCVTPAAPPPSPAQPSRRTPRSLSLGSLGVATDNSL